MCVYFIDAQILNFSVDTDSQLYLPIPIKEFHFLKKKNLYQLNYTRNPLIWYITIILEVKTNNKAQTIL